MQWTGPGSGQRDQVIGQKWLTRAGPQGFLSLASVVTYRLLGYPGKNMRGVTLSYAVRDADIQTEFGADVVLTDGTAGVAEDLLFPAGVLDDNFYLPDEPWSKRLLNIVMFGRVEYIYCKAPATVDQTLLTLAAVGDNGICANFGIGEFTSSRRILGSGTSTGNAGPFSLLADTTEIDWTNAQTAPGVDTTAATGLASGSGGVPTVSQGVVGVCKYGAGISGGYPDAPLEYTSAARRRALVMCMGTSIGRI